MMYHSPGLLEIMARERHADALRASDRVAEAARKAR